jgi:POT family proton-dependent oligopeptide transporter
LVVGTGLLKPNISVMVGQLYPEGGAARDAGFTIFYMGINLGAAIGPLVCSTLGEKLNWHYGFAAAGVGMVFGLVQYRLTQKHLGEAGRRQGHAETPTPLAWGVAAAAMAALVIVTGLVWSGILPLNPVALAHGTSSVIVGLAAVYFLAVLVFGGLSRAEKGRVCVIAVLFVSSAMFWSGFEQAGSSLNLFAERHTARVIHELNFQFEIPAGWFQSLNPIFIITLAPVVAMMWLRLAARRRNPSLPMKFAVGLVLLGLGFLVMVGAARLAVAGQPAAPTWLITTYLLHSVGELCLSPVGLSSVTKLAPRRFVGQMMGIWFLATSLGNLFAGLIAGEVSGDATGQMPGRFLQIVLTTCGTGLLLVLFAKPIRWLMGNIQ